MRFAHTIVEEPKYGASSREAVISVASAPMPGPEDERPERAVAAPGPRVVALFRRGGQV